MQMQNRLHTGTDVFQEFLGKPVRIDKINVGFLKELEVNTEYGKAPEMTIRVQMTENAIRDIAEYGEILKVFR